MNLPSGPNSHSRVCGPRKKAKTSPLELVATPCISPMVSPGGILKKLGTASYGRSGALAYAVAADCANAAPGVSNKETAAVSARHAFTRDLPDKPARLMAHGCREEVY